MIRTPEQYIEGLRDGRVVYQDGRRIPDVTKEPAYKRGLEGVASEYHLALQPEYRELFNILEDGEECSFSYHVPSTTEDIERRRKIIQTSMRLNCLGSRFAGIDGLNGFGSPLIPFGSDATEHLCYYA